MKKFVAMLLLEVMMLGLDVFGGGTGQPAPICNAAKE